MVTKILDNKFNVEGARVILANRSLSGLAASLASWPLWPRGLSKCAKYLNLHFQYFALKLVGCKCTYLLRQ